MALSDEERQAFVDVASKLVAWGEAAELKAQQSGKSTTGNEKTLALANQLSSILVQFYRNRQIACVRFRGTLFILNAMTGAVSIIPERGIETIAG